MPAFRFQLEGVLRYRKSIERERQRQVAVIQGELQAFQDELKQLDRDVQDASAELRQNRLTGRLDLNFLLAHRRFVAAMQRKAMGVAQKMALVQRRLDESRKALTEAAVQRKVIEKLRERQYQRWLAAMDKREREELDEIGMQLRYRQMASEVRADDESGEGR
ncbi:MAG TPA: flagellar export protein FliJ [Tepidisphaeraceae bacterium]|nr:flagellar export protein FliJ [Tepidisphaeraceae bacterium]